MCLLNLWEQVPDADKDPYDPWWQTGFTPLKTDKRVNGHRHTHSLYMSCDDHVINYSSKKKNNKSPGCLFAKAQMGQWAHFSGFTHSMHVQSHTPFLLIKWTQQSADSTQREAERRCSLTAFFFISALTSNKDIHHTRSHPTPTSLPPTPPPPNQRLRLHRRQRIIEKHESREKHDALPHFKKARRLPWFSLHQCWWQMKRGRGDWSTLQPHIPFTNVCPRFHPSPFNPLRKNYCHEII